MGDGKAHVSDSLQISLTCKTVEMLLLNLFCPSISNTMRVLCLALSFEKLCKFQNLVFGLLKRTVNFAVISSRVLMIL